MDTIIGRKHEQSILQRLFDSRSAEFLAIYGRRRIGKTYLIRRFYEQKTPNYFPITGVKDATIKEQLTEFTKVVEKTFYPTGTKLKEASTWMQALEQLTNAFTQITNDNKIILFF